MQGDAEILEILNDVLTAELTAINQYFIHSKMCGNWGYDRLEEHGRHESIDEMKHADIVAEQLRLDVELEYAAVERLNNGIAVCVAKGDNGTRELLAGILVSEEDHIDWLETQQETIRQIGIEAYLAQQLHE
jgi:bacterioferritin